MATSLAQHSRRIEARAKPLTGGLVLWLARYARVLLEREIGRQVRKDDEDDRARDELADLIRLFGLRTLQGAAAGVAGSAIVVPESLISDFLASKDVRITGIMSETRDQVRNEVRRVIAEAAGEQPTPSAGEIARRLRASFSGESPDQPFVLSPERASLIARTELVQAENTGIVEGYRATGVQEIEWLAYTDGASGDRHHERLNGQKVPLGETFTTPLGNELRYPGDPDAPIEDTANCRCTVAPVRRGR